MCLETFDAPVMYFLSPLVCVSAPSFLAQQVLLFTLFSLYFPPLYIPLGKSCCIVWLKSLLKLFFDFILSSLLNSYLLLQLSLSHPFSLTSKSGHFYPCCWCTHFVFVCTFCTLLYSFHHWPPPQFLSRQNWKNKSFYSLLTHSRCFYCIHLLRDIHFSPFLPLSMVLPFYELRRIKTAKCHRR